MYNGPIVKAAVYPGFDDNDKGNPIRIYARIQEDITMKQDIYDLTVAYILENQEKCYRLAYSYVQDRDSALDVVHMPGIGKVLGTQEPGGNENMVLPDCGE